MTDKIQRANLTGTIGTSQPHGRTGADMYSASYCTNAYKVRPYRYRSQTHQPARQKPMALFILIELIYIGIL